MLTPRIRLLLGVVTVAVFVVVGATMLADGQTLLGGVILALGLLRAVLLAQQWLAYRASE